MAAVLYNVANRILSGLASTKLWEEKSKESQQAVTPYIRWKYTWKNNKHSMNNRKTYTNINLKSTKKSVHTPFSPQILHTNPYFLVLPRIRKILLTEQRPMNK